MRRLKFLLLIFGLLGICYLFREPLLQASANYLIVEENLQKSDVIIVLGGEILGERTMRAVELYESGVSHQLLFSDGTDLSWRTRAVDEMTALARNLGIPQQQILTEEQSRSTYENALYTKEVLLEQGWDSAVVVTTNWHTRRAKFIFDKVYEDTTIDLHYATAPDIRIDSLDQWWKDSEKQQIVLTEWAKLIVYWLKY